MFSLTEIPTEIEYRHCIKELNLADGAEWLTADLLHARLASAGNPGFDVYKSELFPNLTFQVKLSRPGEARKIQKTVNGRDDFWDTSPAWTWHEAIAESADFYVLYGVNGDEVYPFVVPLRVWTKEAYDTGIGGLILRVSVDQYSHCGRYKRSFKRNKFWQYLLKTWPDDLFRRIAYYTKYEETQQLSLVATQAA